MTVASIDIGTNTILLLIAEVDIAQRSIKSLLNEQRIPRIGKGLKQGNPIAKEKVNLLISILNEYSEIIKKYNCQKVIIAGTNALRIASNDIEIKNEIKKLLNFELEIISGEEEAITAFAGATFEYPGKEVMVIDIGGGSTELSFGKNNIIYFNRSFQIGVVSGTESYFTSDPPTKENISDLQKSLIKSFLEIKDYIKSPEHVIAIAGTPTTLACIKKGLKVYDEDEIEGSTLSINDLNNLVEELSGMNSNQIKSKFKSVVEGREDLIFAGILILKSIMEIFEIKEITVSTKGIRYGLIVRRFFKD